MDLNNFVGDSSGVSLEDLSLAELEELRTLTSRARRSTQDAARATDEVNEIANKIEDGEFIDDEAAIETDHDTAPQAGGSGDAVATAKSAAKADGGESETPIGHVMPGSPLDPQEDKLNAASSDIEALDTAIKHIIAERTRGASGPDILGHGIFAGIGEYTVPVNQTLSNQFELIYDRKNELTFYPPEHQAFDHIVAEVFVEPAFSMDNHPRYFDYEPLRDNVATVRNYLYAQILEPRNPDDPEQHYEALRMLEQMGREVGAALQRDTIFRKPGTARLSIDEASEPGVGAAKIYELLVKQQDRSPLLHPIDAIRDRDYWRWNLPRVEDSPFSKENVENFCLGDMYDKEHADPALAEPPAPALAPAPEPLPDPEPEQLPSTGHELFVLGAALTYNALSLEKAEQLPEPVKEEAIELAREILEKLRVSLCDDNMENWKEHPPAETLEYTSAIAQVADLYSDTLKEAMSFDKDIKANPEIMQANMAVGKLAYMAKEQAIEALEQEGNFDDAATIRGELEFFPDEWKQIQGDTVGGLLAQMHQGMEMAVAVTAHHRQQEHAMHDMLEQQGVGSEELQAMKELGISQGGELPPELSQTARAQAQIQRQQRMASEQPPQQRSESFREAVEAEQQQETGPERDPHHHGPIIRR